MLFYIIKLYIIITHSLLFLLLLLSFSSASIIIKDDIQGITFLNGVMIPRLSILLISSQNAFSVNWMDGMLYTLEVQFCQWLILYSSPGNVLMDELSQRMEYRCSRSLKDNTIGGCFWGGCAVRGGLYNGGASSDCCVIVECHKASVLQIITIQNGHLILIINFKVNWTGFKTVTYM